MILFLNPQLHFQCVQPWVIAMVILKQIVTETLNAVYGTANVNAIFDAHENEISILSDYDSRRYVNGYANSLHSVTYYGYVNGFDCENASLLSRYRCYV